MRIKKHYFITLALVLGLLLANQVFIQFSLLNAQQDSRIINLAGKQRLNTQKMFTALVEEDLNIDAFSESLDTFLVAHEELTLRSAGKKWYQTSYDISALDQITSYTDTLNVFFSLPDKEFKSRIENVENILEHMLVLSDKVVKIIENEQEAIIARSRVFELLITIISVLVIGYEVFVVMLPLMTRLRRSQQDSYVKNEKLNQLIGMIGHDLRSPLQNIKSRIQLIQMKTAKLNQSQADLEILMGSLESAEQIVQLMLDKNSEHQPKRQNSVLISQIINDVKRDLSPLIVSNRAEIYLSGDAEFEWNPTEIRLVFQNLVSNAIKYAKKGVPAKINIVITDTSSHLNITVSDNGMGISEETQSIIFDYRSKGTLKQDKASFGIGLSHCKEIVTDLGGRIWVKSEPDKGSEFHLEFPKQ